MLFAVRQNSVKKGMDIAAISRNTILKTATLISRYTG